MSLNGGHSPRLDPRATPTTAPGLHVVNHRCAGSTGAGTCASKLGQPDLGFASLNDMREHAEMIANLDPSVPLIADADAGYGGPNMVARTIQTKRCGHLSGKELVSTEVLVQKITAAAQERERLQSDILIIARTDALQTHNFDETILRLKAAIKAGADIAFLEGINSKEQCKAVREALAPTPVLLNMVEHSATPSLTPNEAQELGFRIIIFPFAAIAPAYEAIRQTYQNIKTTGRTGLASDFTPKKLFTVVGLGEAAKVDAQAGGAMYSMI
ncbi:uncharacterized protein Z518_03524 [Rhinocladiella mackenziei CBS 650.93]|uniref:Methylisocitrate lyase n=1 Tax=Rhinocladiella mackenziei CBS 650.93 TaxID=1442369 RepID=A0A0D2G2U0_9EURO|nr:uncharacterized protein Z518_03524 [Rhinocladiella mackenziei CBS 650.93]KIX08867.1 hypothetical protein Z518_03524 [Rhinocladiella mackenziei CBS 650.93]